MIAAVADTRRCVQGWDDKNLFTVRVSRIGLMLKWVVLLIGASDECDQSVAKVRRIVDIVKKARPINSRIVRILDTTMLKLKFWRLLNEQIPLATTQIGMRFGTIRPFADITREGEIDSC